MRNRNYITCTQKEERLIMNVIYLKYKNTKRLAVTRNSRDYSVLDTEKSL